MTPSGIWYKVRHPMFSPNMAYQAVDYILNGDTSWGHLVFILPSGHTWATLVFRCTALPERVKNVDQCRVGEGTYYRWMTPGEVELPFAAKPTIANPDVETDLPT